MHIIKQDNYYGISHIGLQKLHEGDEQGVYSPSYDSLEVTEGWSLTSLTQGVRGFQNNMNPTTTLNSAAKSPNY